MRCRLKEVREHYNQRHPNKKISQAELARRVGVSQPTITRAESGDYEPGAFLLKRIAEVFGLRRMEILIDVDRNEVRRLRREPKRRGRPPKVERTDAENDVEIQKLAQDFWTGAAL